MLIRIILHLIILCSLNFFNLSVLENYSRFISLLGVMLIVAIIVLNAIYGKASPIRRNYTIPVLLVFTGFFTSLLYANIHYDQQIFSTLWEGREMFLYLGYFMIHLVRPDPKEIERIIVFYALLFIVLYILQYVIFPYELFNVKMFEDRGTIRISLPGVTYILVGYFLMLQKYLLTNKLKYMLVNFMILLIVILLGGRQLLLIILFLTVISLIISRKIKNKLSIYFLILIGMIPLYFIFQNIFLELLSATAENIGKGGSDMRIKAIRYFLLDSFPNTMSYITGNGIPSTTSAYGRRILMISSKYKYFVSDIGIIGNYFYYGLFFVAGVLFIFYKTIIIKICSNESYLKYTFYALLIMLPTGGGFTYGEFILPMTFFLYYLDVSNYRFYSSLPD
jgi:hypothetical protein